MHRQDVRELPAVGRYCNPAGSPSPCGNPVAGVRDGSRFWFLGPCAPCWSAGQEVHITGTLGTQFHSDTPAVGEIAANRGARGDSAVLRVCSQIPPWTPVVHGLLGTPVSLCHLDPRHACALGTPAFGASLEKAESPRAGAVPLPELRH